MTGYKLRAMGSRRTAIRTLAAAASGTLAAALFPPYDVGALVWICLLPLLAVLWTLEGPRRTRAGLIYGGIAGLVSCILQFHWFGIVAPVAAVLLPAYLALYWAAFGAFAATLGNPWREESGAASTLDQVLRSLRFAFCIAAAWAGLEWFRGWFLTGFGWNGLGVAFHNMPMMAQSADLLGVTALSMVPVFLQAVLLQTAGRMIQGARTGRRQTRLDFGIAALLVALLVSYGLVRIATETRKPAIRLKTMLIQLNIPQQAARRLWEPLQIHLAYEEETLSALEQVIDKDARQLQQQIESSTEGEMQTHWPDWVMWPEAALSGSILTTPDGAWASWEENTLSVSRVREAGPFQLIYGVTEYEGRRQDDGMLVLEPHGKAWNSLAVQSPQNDLQMHRKHHLVWFGETIPLVDQIPWLKAIYEAQSGAEFGGSFTAGTSVEPLLIPLANGERVQAIPTICYEDSVPRLTRRFVRDQPQVIVNVTNDGWFKESAAAAQHFANAKFRCIELRRPMIRCANNGVSAALNTIGTTAHPDTGAVQVLVDAQGSHFTRGSLLCEIDIPREPTTTLYTVIGDWGVIGLSFSGIALAWWRRPRAAQDAIPPAS